MLKSTLIVASVLVFAGCNAEEAANTTGQTATTTTIAGADKQIFFNDAGAIGASSKLSFDKTHGILSLSAADSTNLFVGSGISTETVGINNSFFGTLAGTVNTTGHDNTFIGYGAGRYNLGGSNTNFASYNTFIGSQAGTSNSTGLANVAIGSNAGEDNVSSNFNVFIGVAAGANHTTSDSNTFIGYSSGYGDTGGSLCTFVGHNSGIANSTGSGNVFIGASAGLANTTGTNNTSIGKSAGPSTNNLSNSTAIGYNASVDQNNKVRIGNTSITVIEGQVAWTNASDRRLKKDIKECSLGLDFITSLRPVEYKMKNGNGKRDFGFIAQEVQELFPDEDANLVSTSNNKERTLGLRYNDFMAPMVRAIQEQQGQIKTLQSTVEEQRKQINELQKSIRELMNRTR